VLRNRKGLVDGRCEADFFWAAQNAGSGVSEGAPGRDCKRCVVIQRRLADSLLAAAVVASEQAYDIWPVGEAGVG
jgi:hypothetical protein